MLSHFCLVHHKQDETSQPSGKWSENVRRLPRVVDTSTGECNRCGYRRPNNNGVPAKSIRNNDMSPVREGDEAVVTVHPVQVCEFVS